MKKFRYRLEALLRAKEHIEKERQKEHAAVLKQVYDQQSDLGRLGRKKKSTLTRQRDNMAGSISLAEMLIYARYVMKVKRDMVAGGELLKALDKTEQDKRQSLLEASKERKVYEKLKERQRQRFNEDVRSQMTREGDETALNSFRRKNKPT